MHYSQLQSQVSSTVTPGQESEPTVVELRMQGFISESMLGERLRDALGSLESSPRERHDAHDRHSGPLQHPQAILCDLRAVSGYGPRTPTLARRWLGLAANAGIRRVALVAASSVLRTATQVISSNLDIDLRCFPGEDEAQRWLRSASRLRN